MEIIMYRYNFPNRKNVRRKNALDRLKKQSARDEAHSKYIKAQIATLEAKLQGYTISN